jgi:hypothetical protein
MSRKFCFTGKTMSAAIVVALASFATVPRAHADDLNFSYTWSTGNVLSGSLDGTLLSDGNVFDVTSVDSLFVNGVAVAIPTQLYCENEVYACDVPPAVSLDGSYMSLDAVGGSGEAFAFGNGEGVSSGTIYAATGFAGATPYYGGDDSVDPVLGNWSASMATTPEPSSFVLLGTGILGLAGAARRKLLRA